jgi:hypothetical protein
LVSTSDSPDFSTALTSLIHAPALSRGRREPAFAPIADSFGASPTIRRIMKNPIRYNMISAPKPGTKAGSPATSRKKEGLSRNSATSTMIGSAVSMIADIRPSLDSALIFIIIDARSRMTFDRFSRISARLIARPSDRFVATQEISASTPSITAPKTHTRNNAFSQLAVISRTSRRGGTGRREA